MNEEQIIARGTQASELLEHPTFQAVFKELMEIYFNSFTQTSPIDEKAREATYYQTRSLYDITAILNQWVSMKDNIIEDRKNLEYNSEEE